MCIALGSGCQLLAGIDDRAVGFRDRDGAAPAEEAGGAAGSEEDGGDARSTVDDRDAGWCRAQSGYTDCLDFDLGLPPASSGWQRTEIGGALELQTLTVRSPPFAVLARAVDTGAAATAVFARSWSVGPPWRGFHVAFDMHVSVGSFDFRACEIKVRGPAGSADDHRYALVLATPVSSLLVRTPAGSSTPATFTSPGVATWVRVGMQLDRGEDAAAWSMTVTFDGRPVADRIEVPGQASATSVGVLFGILNGTGSAGLAAAVDNVVIHLP